MGRYQTLRNYKYRKIDAESAVELAVEVVELAVHDGQSELKLQLELQLGVVVS